MKKTFGIIMIILGAFLSIPFSASVFQLFHRSMNTTPEKWQAVGFFLGTALIFAVILTLFTLGIKLVKASDKK
jgi:hypothetical protein